jgi:tight adherence protein C
MSAHACDLLQIGAGLAAFASASLLALGTVELTPRLLAGVSRERRGIGSLFRTIAIAPIAAANARWLRGRPRELLEGWVGQAGRPLELRPEELAALAQIWAAACFAAGAALSPWLGAKAAFLLAGVAAASYPILWLRDRIRARRCAIVRALPWALDLLTLSVEAGLDFTAALAKVVERIRRGPLGDELALAIHELRLGKTREEALRGLARRAGIAALTSFVQALVQADRMGTPLSGVLRVLSTQMRTERTQRAEKLANEAPVKLLLPLVFCIFPTLFLMLFGPIGYQAFLGGSF